MPSVSAFKVNGPAELRGDVVVSGAKNSALKLFSAALLTADPVHLDNVPSIADVPVMAEVVRGLGAEVELGDGTACIRAAEVDWHAPAGAVSRIRASVSILGPLVARCGRARLALPGGDRIGTRGIDMHLRGLEAMGATVEQHGHEIEVIANSLTGAHLVLDFPSVGATENLLMAATRASGHTTIENAAREPEIQDLCHLLVAMGAKLDGIGTATLEVEGVDALHGAKWSTCPDRIEAGTWLLAAVATGGDVTVRQVRPADLRLPLIKLEATGCELEVGDNWIRAARRPQRPVDFVTLPYPGFPTDLQPQMMVALTQAPGISMCTENVFESRYAFVDQLARLGANVTIDGHHAVVNGPSALRGATVEALDVRAGIAATIAGLVATGTTTVLDISHVDRGYSRVIDRFAALGASIERLELERPAAT